MIGLALAAAIATGQQASKDSVSLFGVGQDESCAAWLSSPAKEAEGFTWIMGFWSGLNLQAALANGVVNVGHTTDGWGIVGEVKRVCEREPSKNLLGAAMQVYNQFKSDGR